MKKIIITSAAYLLPAIAFAQGVNTTLLRLNTATGTLGQVISALIPIVFAVALLLFFWGLVKYIWGGAEDKDKAKNLMIWAVIALFVMSSVWGIVRLLRESVGIDTNDPSQQVPTVTGRGIN